MLSNKIWTPSYGFLQLHSRDSTSVRHLCQHTIITWSNSFFMQKIVVILLCIHNFSDNWAKLVLALVNKVALLFFEHRFWWHRLRETRWNIKQAHSSWNFLSDLGNCPSNGRISQKFSWLHQWLVYCLAAIISSFHSWNLQYVSDYENQKNVVGIQIKHYREFFIAVVWFILSLTEFIIQLVADHASWNRPEWCFP